MSFYATDPLRHRLLIFAAVLGFHLAGLWALQTGLLHRTAAKVMPVLVMAELIEAPRPEITPPLPVQPTGPAHQASPTSRPMKPAAAPAPQPVAAATPLVVPNTPQGVTAPSTAPPALLAAVSEPTPAPPESPAPPQVELPSSSADYLNNRHRPYPTLSRRLGEQGLVVLRVFIEVNGTASQAEVHSSSGYDRLDQTARQTVLEWRYKPGKLNGVAEAMWFNVPIRFDLNKPISPGV